MPASIRSTHQFPLLEPLEPRTLFSILTTLSHFTPVSIAAPVLPTPIAPIYQGAAISAISYEPFTAVIGTITHPRLLPAIYKFTGEITWGDSTAPSSATFIPNPDGTISILGSHQYTSIGSDDITIVLTATPVGPGPIPAATAANLQILLATIHSTATVLSPYGGNTLEPTLHTPFTQTLGTFHSPASLNNMTATIDWGDGTTSEGKILATPVTDPTDPTSTGSSTTPIAGGLFAVQGAHTYATLGSYVITVTITSTTTLPPSPTSTAPSPPIQLVYQFDAIADVLPLFATAV